VVVLGRGAVSDERGTPVMQDTNDAPSSGYFKAAVAKEAKVQEYLANNNPPPPPLGPPWGPRHSPTVGS
jgi:hypothetical protein